MVPEIRKILFASDLSETSKHAFSYALSLAGHYKAQVIFLHVMEEAQDYVQLFLDQEMADQARRESAMEARATLTGKRLDMMMIRSGLKEFVGESLKDHANAVETPGEDDIVIAEGNVVDTIIRTAEERDCDAIALGSRRRGALSELMFGSVVRGVLRNSDRLVIVAPPLRKK